MEKFLYGDEPRAEELIAEIYRQLQVLRASGQESRCVRLPLSYIRRLRIYHALLGSASKQEGEYLDQNGIFGLSFYLHQEKSIIVC